MADFVLARKSRNLFGSFLHAVLNVALGLFSIAATVASASWVPGVLLVFLSKWRVFAVRPRFWWINIKANLVDYIVGLSVVLLAYFAGSNWLLAHYLLMLFYVAWLTFIKPISSNWGNLLQALLALFLGSNLAVILGAATDPVVTVLICFVLGFAACRHILVQDNISESFALPAMVSGLLAAELGYLLSYWAIVYTFGNSGIMISQLALVMTMTAFLFNYLKNSLARYDGQFRASAVALPIICVVLAILVLMFGFSEPFFNI